MQLKAAGSLEAQTWTHHGLLVDLDQLVSSVDPLASLCRRLRSSSVNLQTSS